MRKTSIYIHFPYCLRKCNYCDFVSFPCGGSAPDLLDFYLKELDIWYQKFGRRKVPSIYFGGGTPSLMSPENIEAILERIFALYDVDDDVEITLEVNPKTVNEAKLRDFAVAGVNRISLGVQSLDDEELRLLGRVHTVAEARETLAFAQKHFCNVSCDFIYALPGQSFEKWQQNLEKIATLGVQHLSLYELIVEPKTPLYSWVKKGQVVPVSEVLAGRMFEYTNKFLRSSFPQYEISNYAKPLYQSRHNLHYWNGGDYIGLGVSAAGRICDGGQHFIVENPTTVEGWQSNLEKGIVPFVHLLKKKRAKEMLIMGLRKNAGVNFAEFCRNSLLDFFDVVDMVKFETMISNKFLIQSETGVRVSAKGRSVLDAVIREIIK